MATYTQARGNILACDKIYLDFSICKIC